MKNRGNGHRRADRGASVWCGSRPVAGTRSATDRRGNRKQEKIYGTRGADVPRGYVTGRTLSDYLELLPAGFCDALGTLGSSDRWLDIGAGTGQAILDWTTPHPNTVRHRVKYPRGPPARCVRAGCPSKTAGRTHGNGRPPASARIVYDISPASACGTTRPRNLENSRSSPTCTAASPIPMTCPGSWRGR